MDIKVRTVKRNRIGRDLDLSGTKLRESDVEILYDLVTNINDLLGETRTTRGSYTGFSSDGKFIRTESDTYTICQDDGGIFVDHHHEYHDDDGDSGSYDERVADGRGIINLLRTVFK